MSSVQVAAAVVGATFLAGVASSCSSAGWYECSVRYWTDTAVREFYGQPTEKWETAFSGYNFEDQYDIYLYGTLCVHPPYANLAWTFARQGPEIVAPLKQKLATTDDDGAIRFTILVFEKMQSYFHNYDVADDEELMKVISNSVGRLKSPVWRQSAERQLEAMRTKR